jgi:hypothetical protein
MDPSAISLILPALTSALKAAAWRTITGRDASQRGADLVVTDPEGNTYVIEVQVGDRRPRFGELAQVENLANDYVVTTGTGNVVPVLVTDQVISESVGAAAKEVGVGIVQVGKGTPEEIAQSVSRQLLEREPSAASGSAS